MAWEKEEVFCLSQIDDSAIILYAIRTKFYN